MLVLTETECKEQYKSTLDRIAGAALIQYTLVATVNFIVINSLPFYQFLGFNIAQTTWAGVSHAAAVALNLYVSRNLLYLTKLTKMYPKHRRLFRFLSCHHSWFINPFGLRGVRFRKPVLSSILYLGVLAFGFVPSIQMLDTDKYYNSLPKGYEFWWIYLSVSILSILHFISLSVLINRIVNHGNTLWNGHYFSR